MTPKPHEEDEVTQPVHDMNELTRVLRAWSDLGNAVQEQMLAVLEGEPYEDQNPNALDAGVMVLEQLAEVVNDEVAEALWAEIDGIRDHLRRVLR